MATYESEILLDEGRHNITKVPAYSRILELVQGVRRGLIPATQLALSRGVAVHLRGDGEGFHGNGG